MKNAPQELSLKNLSSSKMVNSEKEHYYLLYKVFKPPRYDNDYFYYTEIFFDWDERE